MSWTSSIRRLCVGEYGPATNIEKQARLLGLSPSLLLRYLEETARRLSDVLGVTDPIQCEREGFRVTGVAGLVRLAPGLELEVCPKFLNPEDSGWREDFFLIATLVRYGRILPKEALRADIREKYSLADLISRAVVEMYEAKRARPLRLYRRRAWRSFDIDGDLEPESLFIRDDNGFLQEGVILDRENEFNEVIYRAVCLLLPEVRDGDLRRKLSEVRLELSPQTGRQRRGGPARRLPSRHSLWQDLYDLSSEVLRGFGVGFRDQAYVLAPGFVIRTASAWEMLLLIGIRSGMADRVVMKCDFPLGARSKVAQAASVPVHVTPDLVIRKSNGPTVPVDAKYKGRIELDGTEQMGISNADLYETLAFMDATGSQLSVLLYPMPGTRPSQGAGKFSVFEQVQVGSRQVLGATVEIRGISEPNGLRSFSLALSDGLRRNGL